uniref:Uncharacterized protein n=1 Tax=Oryza punctata TaxID=4537 RepID=A0A0E0KH28_ORYPU
MAWPAIRSARPRASHTPEKTVWGPWAHAAFNLLIAAAVASSSGEKWRRTTVAKGEAMCSEWGFDGNEEDDVCGAPLVG